MIKNEYEYISTYKELADFLEKRANNTIKNNRLYHFTTYESLVQIIKNKTFMLSLIGTSNDKAEKIFSGETLYYIMSYKEDKVENVNMWYMYGKPSGIKIRIDFSKKELIKCLEKENWSFSNNEKQIYKRKDIFGIGPFYKLSNVAYLTKEKEKYSLGIFRRTFNSLKVNSIEEIKNNYSLSGFIKYDIWEAEKEVRLRIYPWDIYNEEIPPQHLFLHLTDDLIKSIHITFNPWISNEIKTEIKKSINGLCSGYELTFDDSEHNEEIYEM